jgi:hypothetical protein
MSPAETDQDAAPSLDGPRRAVGAHALGRGAQVQPDARRQAEQEPVEPYPLPPRRGRRRGQRLAVPGVDGREIAIVAQADDGIADRGISQAAGPPGRGQRHANRSRQAVAEPEQAPSGPMESAEFGISTEPARLLIERAEHLVGVGAGGAEVFRRPYHDAGVGAQGRALRGGDGIVTGDHRLPRRGTGQLGQPNRRHQSSPRAGAIRALVTTVLPLTVRVVVVVVTPEGLVVATECVTCGAPDLAPVPAAGAAVPAASAPVPAVAAVTGTAW